MHSENALLASLRSNHSFHMHARPCHVMVRTSIRLIAKNLALCSSHSLFYVMHHTPAMIYPFPDHILLLFLKSLGVQLLAISFFLCRLYYINNNNNNYVEVIYQVSYFRTTSSRWWSSSFSSFTTTTGSAIRRWDLIYTFLLRERLSETRMCK